jgi:mono/diheme cytochrome c family protein
VFKWKSTKAGAKPTREDLTRTLLGGIPGTAMPSFVQLADEEIESLLEYVKYLSVRGETERYLLQLVVDEDEYLPHNRERLIEEGLLPAAQSWDDVQQDPAKYVIQPPPEPPMATRQQQAASVALGKQLYGSKNAQCVRCHGPDGRGDGTETELYDDWNKPKKGLTPEQTRELADRYSLPLQRLRPRNYHEGVFRGGNSPEQIYCRIDAGIPGTPMPAAGPAGGTQGVLTPEEIWHVVHYVESLGRK